MFFWSLVITLLGFTNPREIFAELPRLVPRNPRPKLLEPLLALSVIVRLLALRPLAGAFGFSSRHGPIHADYRF